MLKSDEASSRNQIITTTITGHSTFTIGVPGLAVAALVISSTTSFKSQISIRGKILRRTDITIFVNVHPGELFQTSFNDSVNNLIFSFISFLLLIPMGCIEVLSILKISKKKCNQHPLPTTCRAGGGGLYIHYHSRINYLIFFHKSNPITLILLTK